MLNQNIFILGVHEVTENNLSWEVICTAISNGPRKSLPSSYLQFIL